MKASHIRKLTFAAVLAALYAVLTLSIPALQYGPVQVRFAEVLAVLPFFFPGATPGLFMGCFIANVFSPYALDVIFGSAATLLACLWTQRLKNRWIAPAPCVVCNALIVGAEISFLQTGMTGAFWQAFVWNALSVGVGELLACGVLGSLLLGVVYRMDIFRGMIAPERLKQLRGFSC